MSEQERSRRRPLTRSRKLGSRRRRGRQSQDQTVPQEEPKKESNMAKKVPIGTVLDNQIRPELKTPYAAFAKIMVTLLLVILVQTLRGYLPTEASWTQSPQQAELRQVVEPTLRLAQGPTDNYLVTPQLSHAQESMTQLLLEQTGTEVITITVTPTWPEYIGYSLWVCFGLSILCFFFTLSRGEWTEKFRDELKASNILAVASLFGAYAIAAYLGWVWHDPTTFGFMYLTLSAFAIFKNDIPASRGQK